MLRALDRFDLHFGPYAAPQIARVEVENVTNVQKRKRLLFVLIKEPIVRLTEKLRAHRDRLVAIFQDALDRIRQNRQHQYLLGFEIIGASKNIKILIRREDVAFE